jgi:hypothetical protein
MNGHRQYSYALQRETAWKLDVREESGTYITTSGGVILFRLGDGDHCLHFWDKKAKTEISISIDQLAMLAER